MTADIKGRFMLRVDSTQEKETPVSLYFFNPYAAGG